MSGGRDRRAEEGQATAFAVVMVGALLLLAGLVVDGGLALAAKVRAIDEAQEAARAGAQQVDLAVYRETGAVVLDPDRAGAAARAYLASAGAEGTVAVSGDQVSVWVFRDQPAQLLGLVGMRSFQVEGTATARAAHGVLAPEP
jgi:hypothetical protein